MNKKNELALQVLTLAVLASKGIKIARLSGNRNFDEKVVKAKMKSMKANGMLVPAIIVDAKKVIEAGLEIVDFETGEIISAADAARYVVLVDANHRYKGHLNLLEANKDLTYIIHSGFISGYQNRYGDNLKPPTNVYHRMTA